MLDFRDVVEYVPDFDREFHKSWNSGKCLKAHRTLAVCQLKSDKKDDLAEKFSTCHKEELPSKEFYTPQDLEARMKNLKECLKPESE
jgi:hypothetical protein